MNNHQKEQHLWEKEAFPYKTYDEILLEKERRTRFHRGMVVMGGFFLMFCAILIGISMIWNRSTNPLELFHREESDEDRNQISNGPPEQDTSVGNQSFSLAASPLPLEAGQTVEEGVYVADVSGLVKASRAFVVEVEAESYGRQLTCRSGSGVILSEDGYILTEARIINGCDSISVTLNSGEACAAFIIGSDSCSGVAVLKVDAQDLTAAELGDSDLVEVGQAAIAMGSAAGTDFGIISGVDWSIEEGDIRLNFLQTSACINAGNSGGPLLNQYGQVVGINMAGVCAEGYDGMGFALPINQARPIIEELVRSGSVSSRPMLGITGKRLGAMAASFYRLPQGIWITELDPDGGAYAAGLQSGDVITHLDGVRVLSMRSAADLCRQGRVGGQMAVTFYRRGVTLTIQVGLKDQQELPQGGNF